MKINYYFVANIVVISFLIVQCDNTESGSSENDADHVRESEISLSYTKNPTRRRRTRRTTVLTTGSSENDADHVRESEICLSYTKKPTRRRRTRRTTMLTTGSSENDADHVRKSEISLSYTKKPTRRRRTRKTTMLTTTDPRFKVVPKVIIFDLDYVIWPFNAAVDIEPPLALSRYVPSTTIKPKRGQKIDPLLGYDRIREVTDNTGKPVKIYDGVATLLGQIKRSGIEIAVISQTSEIGTVYHLLKALDIDRFFDYTEISVENSTVQIQSIKEKSGRKYEDMIFYSAYRTRVDEAVKLKIVSVLVPGKKGLKSDVFFNGVNQLVC